MLNERPNHPGTNSANNRSVPPTCSERGSFIKYLFHMNDREGRTRWDLISGSLGEVFQSLYCLSSIIYHVIDK